jgi:FkbM family methyltransferase
MVGFLETLKNNRPSRKPQLWEHFPLALRRRVSYELARRFDRGWLDRPRVEELAELGVDGERPPLKIELLPRDGLHLALYLYGVFEISESSLLLGLLEPGMTFVDVGANIGYYSLIAARAVGPTGAVHCFEPNDPIRERALKNVAMNGLSNVFVHGEAVSRATGEVRFYESEVAQNSGISSIIAGAGLNATGKVVPAVSLDDFARRIGRKVDVIKMDIEGAELQAIEGGHELLSRADGPAILFESFRVQPLLEALEARGYSVRKIHYTMAGGLELRDAREQRETIFAKYESPNFCAVKDPAQFNRVTEIVNARRSWLLKVLGQI